MDLLTWIFLAFASGFAGFVDAVAGGAGSEVERTLQSIGLSRPCLRIGLPDQFIEHGDMTNLYKSAGLDADSLHARIQQFLSN